MQDALVPQESTETSDFSKLAEIAEQFNEKPSFDEVKGVEIDSATLLANLEEKRAKGTFTITHYSSQKLSKLIQFLKTKAKFKGIQESYFIIALQLELAKLIANDATLKQNERIADRNYELPASIIEVIVYFLNKHESSGLAAADDFLRISMPLNNALANVQTVDAKIKELRIELGLDKPATK